MKRKLLVAGLIFGALLSGCATTVPVTPAPLKVEVPAEAMIPTEPIFLLCSEKLIYGSRQELMTLLDVLRSGKELSLSSCE